jgi:hypothetical protein
MSKTMYGIAAGLALVTSTAWADAGKSGERSEGEATERASVTMIDPASATSLEASRSSAPQTGSNEARTSREETPSSTKRDAREEHDDAWLQMREGYRDGGY